MGGVLEPVKLCATVSDAKKGGGREQA